MTYERFLTVLLGLQKQDKVIDNLYNNGVDLMDFVDPYYGIINELIKEVYGEDGYQWFSWYCYESEFGQRDWSKGDTYRLNEDGTSELIHEEGKVRFGAYDEQGNPICYSHESLWEYLEKNCKTYTVKRHKK